jgi:hypothetical protein
MDFEGVSVPIDGLSRWGTRCTHQFAHIVHVEASSVNILTHTQARHMQNPYNKTCFSLAKSQLRNSMDRRSLLMLPLTECHSTPPLLLVRLVRRESSARTSYENNACYVWSCIQKLDEKSIYMCPPLTSRC